jgi:hypothetical protein
MMIRLRSPGSASGGGSERRVVAGITHGYHYAFKTRTYHVKRLNPASSNSTAFARE